jgi:enoyl-CoA hydratase
MNQQIIIETIQNLGIITLNRPEALNALNTQMCKLITAALLEWEKNDNVKAVLVKGAGERAFCAGGDIVMLHNSGRDQTNEAEQFWRTEYALNELIYSYPKPYIALIDGITMGGGVGLSVHGKYRIAGLKTLFAMPETGIGYFPDVGGTYFLPRLGRAIGNWMGLTGARIDGAMACKIGVATHYIENHVALIKALCQNLNGSFEQIEDILAGVCITPPQAPEFSECISCFDTEDLGAIYNCLEYGECEWGAAQLKSLRLKSPLAVAITFEAMKRGASLSFREVMVRELDLSLNFLKNPDFYEGIRAQVIDKDRNPNWQFKNINEVTKEKIAPYFEMNGARLKFLK